MAVQPHGQFEATLLRGKAKEDFMQYRQRDYRGMKNILGLAFWGGLSPASEAAHIFFNKHLCPQAINDLLYLFSVLM